MEAYRDQYATLFNGGHDVVLLALSTDPADTLAAWAADEHFPFRLLSDAGGQVGARYGVYLEKGGVDSRVIFVIGPDGKIAFRQAPFRELDPSAYRMLAAAVDSVSGAGPER